MRQVPVVHGGGSFVMARRVPRELIDTNETARRFGRNRFYVYWLKNAGVLGYYRLGGRLLYDAAEVDALLDSAYVAPERAL